MAAAYLGRAKCPLCGCFGARVSLSKNDLSVMTCNSERCRGMQLFARSANSDELMRDLISAEPEPSPAAPSPSLSPSPDEVNDIMQKVVAAAQPPAPSGLMSSWFR